VSTSPALDAIEIETGPNATHSVIWLHGLGADGNDFAPLVPALQIPSTLPVRFVFPHAPVQPVTINGGMVMRSWYDILEPSLVRQEDEAGILASEKAIHTLIEQEMARGIPSERILLAGFSQGCAMTLHTGLRYPKRLAGLICLSGYLPLADRAAPAWHEANRQTPLFIAHGSHDPVVSIERGLASKDLLVANGYAVQWHTYPMPHSVCPEEVGDIASFMRQTLMAG
jgi:phospholipase/carboxylesterase